MRREIVWRERLHVSTTAGAGCGRGAAHRPVFSTDGQAKKRLSHCPGTTQPPSLSPMPGGWGPKNLKLPPLSEHPPAAPQSAQYRAPARGSLGPGAITNGSLRWLSFPIPNVSHLWISMTQSAVRNGQHGLTSGHSLRHLSNNCNAIVLLDRDLETSRKKRVKIHLRAFTGLEVSSIFSTRNRNGHTWSASLDQEGES